MAGKTRCRRYKGSGPLNRSYPLVVHVYTSDASGRLNFDSPWAIMQDTQSPLDRAIALAEAQEDLPKRQRRSLHDIARDIGVPWSTLRDRVSGDHIDRPQAHEYRQLLSPAEEQVIVDYIARSAAFGHPASSTLVTEVAN